MVYCSLTDILQSWGGFEQKQELLNNKHSAPAKWSDDLQAQAEA
jgi:hypothetical protein